MGRAEVRCGAEAIKAELAAQLTAVGGARVEVKTLIADGATVMTEHVSNSSIRGNPIASVVMAVFEFQRRRANHAVA